MQRITLALLPLTAVLTLGACSADRPTLTDAPSARATDDPTTSSTPAADVGERDDNDPGTLDASGLVARAVGDIDLVTTPGGPVTMSLPATTEFGSPTVLAATRWADADKEWLEVLVPVRPNGTTALVRADTVTLGRTSLRVDIDLAGRRLVVHDGDATIVDTSVAIGTPETPTPTGSYFVTDVIDNPDDAGSYGPFALGLSAHSDVLDQFGGGDGQIGIHGTNDPGSIGNAASHGCVRVSNEIITQLAGLIPRGTPVTIR